MLARVATWAVLITDACQTWLDSLPGQDRVAILQDVEVLRAYGPQLGRPHVDHLKGSRHPNMKELRTRFAGHQFRTLFAFDPRRQAILLIGGDKVGQDERRFYRNLITAADALFDAHLLEIAKGKGNP